MTFNYLLRAEASADASSLFGIPYYYTEGCDEVYTKTTTVFSTRNLGSFSGDESVAFSGSVNETYSGWLNLGIGKDWKQIDHGMKRNLPLYWKILMSSKICGLAGIRKSS